MVGSANTAHTRVGSTPPPLHTSYWTTPMARQVVMIAAYLGRRLCVVSSECCVIRARVRIGLGLG